MRRKARLLTPDMVLGPARRGIKVVYCTDTRPVPVIAEYAREADLFICEGMYGEDGKEAKAREYKHMTFYEAAEPGQGGAAEGNVADSLQPFPDETGRVCWIRPEQSLPAGQDGQGRLERRTGL